MPLLRRGHERFAHAHDDHHLLGDLEEDPQMAIRIRSIASAIIIAPLLFIALFPVIWAFLSSLKNLRDIVSPVPILIFKPTLANFVSVLNTPAVQLGLTNSIIVVGSAVAVGVLFGWPAAYSVSRMKGRLKEEYQFFVLSIRFMPPVAVAIPFMAALHESRDQRYTAVFDPDL